MKYKMKLRHRHPSNAMPFGKNHVITNILKVFDLDEKEIKLLKREDAKHWFLVNPKEKSKSKNKSEGNSKKSE